MTVIAKLAFSNLAVRRVRAGLTVAAITLSVSLVVAVTTGYASLEAAAYQFLNQYMASTDATISLVDRIEGLTGIDAGSLSQAAPIEAFTAVLITINIRHKAHTTLRLAGIGDH